jgi:probable HAF family extracellular repeat protein
VILCAAAGHGAWFMPLPQFVADPSQPGDSFAVSADGNTVVGTSNGGSAPLAVRWTGQGEPEVIVIDGFSYSRGVSADGRTVVGYLLGAGDLAFRWKEGAGAMLIGDLLGGDTSSKAFDVSADGNVIVGIGFSSFGGEAFRWTEAGGMVGLGDLPGRRFASEAYGVSSDGSVIVGYSESANGIEAFR